MVGKNFQRYPEAIEMQKLGGVLSISTKEEFKNIWEKLINNEKICLEIGKTNFDFVRRALVPLIR